jgi:hypothetical protein
MTSSSIFIYGRIFNTIPILSNRLTIINKIKDDKFCFILLIILKCLAINRTHVIQVLQSQAYLNQVAPNLTLQVVQSVTVLLVKIVVVVNLVHHLSVILIVAAHILLVRVILVVADLNLKVVLLVEAHQIYRVRVT